MKKLISLTLAMTMAFSSAVFADTKAVTNQNVLINSQKVSFENEIINVDGYNYFELDEITGLLGASDVKDEFDTIEYNDKNYVAIKDVLNAEMLDFTYDPNTKTTAIILAGDVPADNTNADLQALLTAYTDAEKELSEVTSAKFKVNGDMKFNVSIAGEADSMDAKYNMDYALVTTDDSIEALIDMDMSTLDETAKMSMYVNNDAIYMHDLTNDTYTKIEMDFSDFIGQYADIEKTTSLVGLDNQYLKSTEETTLDGQKALKVVFDSQLMSDVANEEMSSALATMGMDLGDLAFNFSDITYTIAFDDDYNVTKIAFSYEVSMNGSLTSILSSQGLEMTDADLQEAGITDDSISIEMLTNMIMEIVQLGDVTIEAPANLDQYVDFTDLITE